MRAIQSNFALVLALIVSMAMSMSACKYLGGGADEDWVVIKGSALSSDEPTTTTLVSAAPALAPLAAPAFREMKFESRATAAFPAIQAAEAQREAFARAEARRTALRSLGEKVILHQPARSGGNLSMIFNSLEIQNAEIEAILESAARVFYVRQSDADGVDATAFVSGATISDGIIGARLETMREEAKARSADLTPEERKTNAEVAALESARARALDQVMGIESSLGSMGEILANHPEAGAEIKTWVESAEPEEFTHSPDGVCSTSIKLDMHKPFELIQKYSEQTKPKPKPKKAKKKSAPKAAPKSANEVLPAAPTPAVASEVQGNQP